MLRMPRDQRYSLSNSILGNLAGLSSGTLTFAVSNSGRSNFGRSIEVSVGGFSEIERYVGVCCALVGVVGVTGESPCLIVCIGSICDILSMSGIPLVPIATGLTTLVGGTTLERPLPIRPIRPKLFSFCKSVGSGSISFKSFFICFSISFILNLIPLKVFEIHLVLIF